MDVAGAQAQVTTDNGERSHQVQNRLLHIDTQMAHIRAQVERLVTEASTSSSQFTVLLRHMTDPQPLQGVHERLVALLEHLENQQEQLNLVVSKLPELADKAQLAEISGTMTRLGRTQFKSNALGETREQHIERSLNTLQELLAQREQQHARAAQAPELPPPATSAWQKLRRKFAGQAVSVPLTPPAPCPLPEAVTAMPDVLDAWLQGLTLMRERFLAVLAGEGIEVMAALHTSFDPHLHVAVQTEIRDDVAPQTVIRVLRQGYRQHQRVLRYAEVVVARAADGQQQ